MFKPPPPSRNFSPPPLSELCHTPACAVVRAYFLRLSPRACPSPAFSLASSPASIPPCHLTRVVVASASLRLLLPRAPLQLHRSRAAFCTWQIRRTTIPRGIPQPVSPVPSATKGTRTRNIPLAPHPLLRLLRRPTRRTGHGLRMGRKCKLPGLGASFFVSTPCADS